MAEGFERAIKAIIRQRRSCVLPQILENTLPQYLKPETAFLEGFQEKLFYREKIDGTITGSVSDNEKVVDHLLTRKVATLQNAKEKSLPGVHTCVLSWQMESGLMLDHH